MYELCIPRKREKGEEKGKGMEKERGRLKRRGGRFDERRRR